MVVVKACLAEKIRDGFEAYVVFVKVRELSHVRREFSRVF